VKFKFIASEDNTHTTKEFETDYLYEVIPQFEEFLRGCGFVFDGHLDTFDDSVEENKFTNKIMVQDCEMSKYKKWLEKQQSMPLHDEDVDMDGRC
jgi:hypothetical protein